MTTLPTVTSVFTFGKRNPPKWPPAVHNLIREILSRELTEDVLRTTGKTNRTDCTDMMLDCTRKMTSCDRKVQKSKTATPTSLEGAV